MFALRLSPETRKAVREWASQQEDSPSESVAMRRLIEQALDATKKKR
jgi:hypothetical protein